MRTRILFGLATLAASVALVLPASAGADLVSGGGATTLGPCPMLPSMDVDASVSATCYWPNVSVSVNPTSITEGSSATIDWSVEGQDPAISCQKGGAWSGSIGVDAGGNASGSEVVSPAAGTYTYSITCPANPASGYAEATLSVNGQPVHQTLCRFREDIHVGIGNVNAIVEGHCSTDQPLMIKVSHCLQKSFNLGASYANVSCNSATYWQTWVQNVASYKCKSPSYGIPYMYRGQSIVRVTEVFTGRTAGDVATSHPYYTTTCG